MAPTASCLQRATACHSLPRRGDCCSLMEMAPSEHQGLQGRTAPVTRYPPSGGMLLDHPAPCISSFIPLLLQTKGQPPHSPAPGQTERLEKASQQKMTKSYKEGTRAETQFRPSKRALTHA